MLKFIFFFFGVIAIIYEMWSIMNINSVITRSEKARKSITDKSIEFSKSESIFGICHLLYMCWGIVGLFSSQWPIFILLILLSCVRMIPILSKSKSWFIFDSVITIIMLFFAIINAHHLHISFNFWK